MMPDGQHDNPGRRYFHSRKNKHIRRNCQVLMY